MPSSSLLSNVKQLFFLKQKFLLACTNFLLPLAHISSLDIDTHLFKCIFKFPLRSFSLFHFISNMIRTCTLLVRQILVVILYRFYCSTNILEFYVLALTLQFFIKFVNNLRNLNSPQGKKFRTKKFFSYFKWGKAFCLNDFKWNFSRSTHWLRSECLFSLWKEKLFSRSHLRLHLKDL